MYATQPKFAGAFTALTFGSLYETMCLIIGPITPEFNSVMKTPRADQRNLLRRVNFTDVLTITLRT